MRIALGPLAALGRWASARWQRWWQARHPRSTTWTLTQRRLYILPTGAGLVYAVLLLGLLVGSINDQLNLGYLLTFVLAGAGLVALHASHATLSGLQLSLGAAPGTVAGRCPVGQVVTVTLHCTDTTPPGPWRRWLSIGQGLGRFGIDLRWQGDAAGDDAATRFNLPPGGTCAVHRSFTPLQRGEVDLPALRIDTRFPLGLFCAWSVWRPDQRLRVWPAPEQPPPPWPAHAASTDAVGETAATPTSLGTGAGDSDGARPWRPGDTPRQVLWRLSARSLDAAGPLWVRDRLPPPAPQQAPRWLRWDDTADLTDPEARLSRLCAWVLQADADATAGAAPFGLALPDRTCAPGLGPAHRDACLDALALCQPATTTAAAADPAHGPRP